MSAVSEAVARRMTLGYLADTYGLELDPDFASGVTVTSIADDVDSVAPGSLYVPAQSVDVKRLEEARARGAYAALVPPSMKHEDGPAQMPLLRARLTSRQLGDIASDIAGTPSNALAIFVVGSDDPKRSERYASCVADFLHMLGNPVGVVKSSGSTSLERELDLTYPLSILDVQQTLSVCAEDGAAAMVFALNDRTLKSDALTSVNVDVIGLDSARDLRQPTPSGTGEDSRAGEGGEAASPSGQWASGEEPAGSAGDARDDLAQARQAQHLEGGICGERIHWVSPGMSGKSDVSSVPSRVDHQRDGDFFPFLAGRSFDHRDDRTPRRLAQPRDPAFRSRQKRLKA